MSEEQQYLQNKLNECYKKFREEIEFDDNELAKNLSAPLLIQIPEKWTKSKIKVLVIGQETLGWQFLKDDKYYKYDWEFSDINGWADFKSARDSVDALVSAYKMFDFSSNDHTANHRAPFFSAYRKIRNAVGDSEEGFETSVLWTNLIRMSVNGGSIFKNTGPKQREDIINASTEVFRDEIKILKPDVAIFFTGPVYDYALEKVIEGLELHDVLGYQERVLAEVSHDILPKMSWRTYHPAYLRRSGRSSIIDYLCDQVKVVQSDGTANQVT